MDCLLVHSPPIHTTRPALREIRRSQRFLKDNVLCCVDIGMDTDIMKPININSQLICGPFFFPIYDRDEPLFQQQGVNNV